MCVQCVENLAHEIGAMLEEEGDSPEVVFAALHAVARVVERQFDMPAQRMAELQYVGRDIGNEIADEMQLPLTSGDDEDYRELVASATVLHHRNDPD
jgi:hypothetical protein